MSSERLTASSSLSCVRRCVTAPVETAQLMRDQAVLPVVELESLDHAAPLAAALVTGGLRAIEITLRTEVALAAIASLASHEQAVIGAGTIRSVEDAQRAINAGARFVVSPTVQRDVIEHCLAANVFVLPGACTPTEVNQADQSGATMVKFFPAEAMGGTAFLRALAGPFKGVSFVPTGGINATNLKSYLELPTVAACGGSWMVSREIQRQGAYERIESLAREASDIAAAVRGLG